MGRDRSEESIKGLKEFDVKLVRKKYWMQILEGKYLLSQSAIPGCRTLTVWHSSPIREVMEFYQNELYHIYNRGNNKQRIFYNDRNYVYFLEKVRKFMVPHCEILAYSLMPNHFHFYIYSDVRTICTKRIGNREKNVLSEGIRNLLSSYTQAINNQNNTTGSLFQQNTKAKAIVKGSANYDLTCLHYIHQNPVAAKLVKRMEDWPYSSFRDYCGLNNETICNIALAVDLLGLNMGTFY